MTQILILYAELLVFLVGTVVYGFLARELIRNPAILPGLPVRLLATCLTVWYAGCLVDQLAAIFLPVEVGSHPLAAGFDLVRAAAWLVSFPLLSHTLWRLSTSESVSVRRTPERPVRFLLVPGYLTLLLFLPAAWQIWQRRSAELAVAAHDAYGWIVLHTVLSISVSSVLILLIVRATDDAGLARFLRWLLPALVATLALISLGWIYNPDRAASGVFEGVWRLFSESSGLVLGLTFLYFVQRYNLLRLSLSFRSLRHFVAILALVMLVMMYGTLARVEHTAVSQRIVGWSLVVALLVITLYTPVRRTVTSRSRWVRRILGESIGADEIESLGSRIHSIDLAESEMLETVEKRLGLWLVTRARFLPRPTDDESAAAPLWDHFRQGGTEAFNRLGPPDHLLAEALNRSELHAAFPLRVDGALEGVLGLEISAAGGGYQDGEMESVRLVLRQLSTALELRRMVEARIADVRRMADRERLSLLGMVSASLVHEVKNPLSSMKVLAQTVREELDEVDPGSERAEDLGLIVDTIDRLNAVAHEILGFARPPNETTESDTKDLNGLLAATLGVMRYQARTRQIVIDTDGVEAVGLAPGTPATWQTILVNLLTNAVDYAPQGSTVQIRLMDTTHRLIFETENPGPVINEAETQELFEEFAGVRGTGLGLSLVRRRVQELDGTVELFNPTGRVVFRVTIPNPGRPRAAAPPADAEENGP